MRREDYGSQGWDTWTGREGLNWKWTIIDSNIKIPSCCTQRRNSSSLDLAHFTTLCHGNSVSQKIMWPDVTKENISKTWAVGDVKKIYKTIIIGKKKLNHGHPVFQGFPELPNIDFIVCNDVATKLNRLPRQQPTSATYSLIITVAISHSHSSH